MISFASPWMAWGAVAAVGLPVLAHLLSRTRYREVLFPAARLVQRAVAATSRIETPRHRLLMLLRWLILMLLVLAFMRPQWTPRAEAGGEDGGVALVLLLDRSASMQRTRDGTMLYDRAKREAGRLLDRLDPSRDVAAVITVDDASASLLPVATARFSQLAEQLDATEAGYTHANWPAAVATVHRLTRDESRAVRIVTLSDQQGTQPDLGVVSSGRANLGVDHLRIDGPSDNTAIRLVDVRPYPASAGQPMTATLEARHFGDRPTTVGLTCLSDQNETQRTITLGPSETRRVDFRLPTTAGEQQRIEFHLEPSDPLTADNIAGAVVPTRVTHTVLVVHDANASSRSLAARLSLLLNPGDIAGAVFPQVRRVAIDQADAQLSEIDPAGVRTVVLLNQQPLPDQVSQSLEAYTQQGGGIVRFVMDASVDPAQKSRAAGIDFDLEPLRVFEGPARAGLSALPWSGVSSAAIDPRARPILMDDQERVIVAAMPRGRGRLIAINAMLSAEPGGLLAEPAFVVLFNELCRYASPGPTMPAPPRPGDPMPMALLDADQRRVPDRADPTRDVFTAPGLYAATTSSGAIRDASFVALDPAESDTRTPAHWAGFSSANSDNAAAASQPDTTTASAWRADSIELWPALLLAALGLVAVESLLLWRFARPAPPALTRGAA